MRGHQLNKGGARPEHQDRAGSPRGAVAFINQTGQSRDTPASVTAPSKAVAGPKYTQSTTAKGFFPQIMCKSHFSYHYFEMCMCHVLQRTSGYKPLGVTAKPCWLLQLFGQPA